MTEPVQDGLRLTAKDIHNKDFKTKFFGGYNQDEVNEYLDEIIMDYRYVEDQLLREVAELRKEIIDLKNLISSKPDDWRLLMLERISKLEKKVFGM